MDCFNNCKYYFRNLLSGMPEYNCTFDPMFVIPDDDDNFSCPNYAPAKNCLTCNHSWTQVYETGTIDCIEYYCRLQGEKVIYNDSNPMNHHHYDIPECQIAKWERDKYSFD